MKILNQRLYLQFLKVYFELPLIHSANFLIHFDKNLVRLQLVNFFLITANNKSKKIDVIIFTIIFFYV